MGGSGRPFRMLVVALAGAAMLWVGAAGSALALTLVVDRHDDNPGATACTAAPNDCSLRGAIIKANTSGAGPHTITLPTMTLPVDRYDLAPDGLNEDGAMTGDLDILQNITINGVSPDTTVISYADSTTLAHRDRIFHVLPAGSLTLRDLSVRGGGHGTTSGLDKGGGVWAQGPLTMERVSVRLNSQVQGGGVYTESTTVIRDSTINLNTAFNGGGILIGGDAAYTATILNTTIGTNGASDLGGGIYFNGITPGIVATLNNVTVAENTAPAGGTGGGGLYVGTIGSLVVRNTIVANNTGSNSNCAGAVTSQGHNLEYPTNQCGFSGNGDIVNTHNPNLGPLQGNGGPTATYALRPNSAALDKGDTAPPGSGGTACEANDQRGLPRTLDGDSDGIARCDIGAVEGGVWYAVDTTTDSNLSFFQVCDGDPTNSNCSLRGAISKANSAEAAVPGTAAVITLPARGAGSPYLLAGAAGEDQNATGDLDILADVTIVGGGATTTVIDANQIDRVFDVQSSPPATRLRLQDLTVQNGNVALAGAGAGSGGGIRAVSAFSLLRVRVRANTALEGGGIIANRDGTITDSLISANNSTLGPTSSGGMTVDDGGGGIRLDNITLTITNTTIAGNHAQNGGVGGGLFQSTGGATTLKNVTIAGNGGYDGGGLNLEGAGSITLQNTIVAGNSDGIIGSENCAVHRAPTSQGFNLVFGGGTCGLVNGLNADIVGSDPQLGPLQFNGGPTETMALGAGSAAIDTGNSATPGSGPFACTAADQRGTARPIDGNGVGGPRCDIGAYEAQFCTTRPNVALGVAPGSPGRIAVTVTAGSGNIVELHLHALPSTNVLVNVGAGDRSGELVIPINAPSKQFTLRRASGTGAGTLPFDVVDACGLWKTLAGGGAQAWPVGSGPFGGTPASQSSAPSPPAQPAELPPSSAPPGRLRPDVR